MAADYLQSRGIDIDAEMSRIQLKTPPASQSLQTTVSVLEVSQSSPPPLANAPRTVDLFRNVSLHNRKGVWDVSISCGQISDIRPHVPKPGSLGVTGSRIVNGDGALLAPSPCHPHIHLDKAFLLQHPKYAHLQVSSGDFKEAMDITSQAKLEFEEWDLLERGQRLIEESIEAGVTHMRAFVEVDADVGTKCLDAGIKLKQQYEQEAHCVIQLCAFAQLPLFTSSSNDERGEKIRALMNDAAAKAEVDVVGSTPYVEESIEKQKQNIDWLVDHAIEHDKHIDFHLDYHLDAEQGPMVWHVIRTLKASDFVAKTNNRTVVLGHCTRLILFSGEEWQRLATEIADLPISFVGLPTSDLFIHGRTLPVTRLIKEYSLSCCVGVNNIGNAFTPAGSPDPFLVASMGTSIYQAGTQEDAELLYECVSTRATRAIGLGGKEGRGASSGLEVVVGDKTDMVLFGSAGKDSWATRKTVKDAVYFYDGGKGRKGVFGGKLTIGK